MSEALAGLAAGAQAAAEAAADDAGPANAPHSRLATLWQLASGFFEAQADGLLQPDAYSKRLGSKLLAQLRSDELSEPSQRLAQDLLFFCSQAQPAERDACGPRLAAVCGGYSLAPGSRVDYELTRLGRFDPAWVAQAHKRVSAAKEVWSAVAGGDTARLPGLPEQFALVSDSLGRLYPDGAVLGRALQVAVSHAAALGGVPPAALAMEVATALLYLDASIDDGDFDHPESGQRVQRLARRIDAVRQERDPGTLELWMEELYRRVSDRQTMGSVVQELRAALSEIEKNIDQYFRDPAQRDVLIPVPAQLSAMRGVLSVLGLDQASQAVLRMRDDVDELANTEVNPQHAIANGTFDRLADNLGALSFLIDMVSVQPQMAKSLFRFNPATGSLAAVMARADRPTGFDELDSRSHADAASPADTDALAVTLDFDRIVRQARETQRTAARRGNDDPGAASTQPTALRLAPADPLAGLNFSMDEGQPTVTGQPLSDAHEAMAQPHPAPLPVAPASVAAVSSGLEDDPEMRAIFLEEALEVLQSAREALTALQLRHDDIDAMTRVRRSFHTLKGSARMVGLSAFGEAAWACEQLYNTRLAEHAGADADLRGFSSEACARLEAWTQALSAGDAGGHTADAIVQAADVLRTQHRRLPLPDSTPAALPAPAAEASAAGADMATVPAEWAAEAIAAEPAPPAASVAVPDDALAAAFAEMPVDVDEAAATAPVELTDLRRRVPDLPLASDLDLLPTSAPPSQPALPERDFAAQHDTPAPAFQATQVDDPELRPFDLPETTEIDVDLPAVFGLPGPHDAPAPGTPPADDLSLYFDVDLPADTPQPEPEPEPEPTVDMRAPTVFDEPPAAAAPIEPQALASDQVSGRVPDVGDPGEPAWPVDVPDAAAPRVEPPFEPPAPAPALVDIEDDDEAYRQIGRLRISLPLFNIYLGEADELSLRLGNELAEWAAEPAHPVGEAAVALAHSLAGSSGTVGYTELSQLARALEHALGRSHARGVGRGGEVELFQRAADEIRRLLHLFAAGFLSTPDAELLQQLNILAQAAPDEASIDAGAELGADDWADSDGQVTEILSLDGHADAAEPVAVPGDVGWNEQDTVYDTVLDARQAPPVEAVRPVEPLQDDAQPTAALPLQDDAQPTAALPLQDDVQPTAALPLHDADALPDLPIEPLTADADADADADVLDGDTLFDEFELPREERAPDALAASEQGSAKQTRDELAAFSSPWALPPAALPPPPEPPPPAESESAADELPPPPTDHWNTPTDWLDVGGPEGAGLGRTALRPFSDLPEAAPRALRSDPDAVAAPFDEDIDQVDAVDAELFPIFQEEAQELLPRLHAGLRDWAVEPANAQAATACMRCLHTFKGGARLAGAMRLGELAHRLETAIERLTAPDVQARADDLDRLVANADILQARLDGLLRPAATAAAEPVAGSAEAAAAQAPDKLEQAATPAVAAAPEVAEPVAPVAPGAPVALGAPLHEAAAAPSSAPAIDWQRFVDTPASADMALAMPAAAASSGLVRVRTPLLDRLVNQSGEVSIARARIESDVVQIKGALIDLSENLDRLRAQLREIELQAETQIDTRMEAARAAAQAFDPLEMDRFTRFQELTRMMAESVGDVATVQRGLQRTLQSTEDALAHQARMTRDMQDDLLRTRMVEFEGLSERLYRVVRQAAKDAGKPVRLDIVGGGVEIDRGVLDRMTPAFEHLLRNCVAHGIEAPEDRAATGKDAIGTVTLVITQAGNEVGVEVRDDGAGLPLARIRERGRAMGLIAPDAEPDEAELANLIFQPGFTTATALSGLAGRGVGMDVVRTDVNAMGGRIETASAPGQGTSFRLVLPLTTAVTQVVMMRCGERSFAVPSTLIEVVRRVKLPELAQAYASAGFSEGGHLLPFFWLDALLQGTPRGLASGRSAAVVVIRSAAQRVVLHVDEVMGNQEVVVKHLGPQLSRVPGLVGMTLLPSGLPALIYNPVALATLYGETARAATAAALAAAGGSAEAMVSVRQTPLAPLVLVVDDSLTVRRITQRLLEREGYRVQVAKDGLDGLDKLSAEVPVVVLTDIEMPRMDGFDLVRNMRADSRLADLPVVMITSRIAQKHRDVAAALGVDHYLGKPYAEDELLSLVARYVRHAKLMAA